MHYSIQQDLARSHYDTLLDEASRAHLAALVRESRADERTEKRSEPLRALFRRLHVTRVRTAPAH
jgi:ribosomal 50S subunit-associated protein YjgA (DUF615 family)